MATCTDNATNFVKAFKDFSIEINLPDLDVNNEPNDSHHAEETNIDNVEEITFLNIIPDDNDVDRRQMTERTISDNYIPDNDDEEDVSLSEHQRCVVHTVFLIPTTDISNCLKEDENEGLSVLNSNTMKKLSKYWNAAGRPKSSEILREHFGCSLKRPCQTRWNSLFDCLQNIIEIGWNKIDTASIALKYPKLLQKEKAFVKEYHMVLKPIAVAVDHLQSENEFYLAAFVPCLLAMEKRYSDMEEDQSFTRRFKDYYNFDLTTTARLAFYATISHPFYKFRFLSIS